MLDKAHNLFLVVATMPSYGKMIELLNVTLQEVVNRFVMTTHTKVFARRRDQADWKVLL